MDTTDIIQSAGIILAFLTFGFGYIRNGRSASKSMSDAVQALRTGQDNINKTLQDEHSGLGAIKASVDQHLRHCAEVVGRFDERIKNNEEKRKD